MTNNKQSSVEYYINNLIEILGDEICNKLTIEQTNIIHFLGKQAKAMHKEEIETAFDKGADIGVDVGSNHDWHEGHNRGYQYYNETFNNENL